MTLLTAYRHIIAASGLRLGRSECDGCDEHKGCRRNAAQQLPHKPRDHERKPNQKSNKPLELSEINENW
jgi:hypothetical protein